jgi:BirA family biotin operon repressor/biotin-[acetyl-CoA-carboxylase] ligase
VKSLPRRWLRVLHEVDETGSTNDDARDLALVGAPPGTAVLARRQSRGRGRAGRAFASPDGGLYLSVVLRPRGVPPAEWGLLPLMAGTMVAAELGARGFDARVKWPNDVLVAGAKVGGILVESRWAGDPFAIVGVGLNIESAPLPDATCLAAHGAAPDRRVLAEAIAARLVARVDAWEKQGRAPLLAEIRAACSTLGRVVEWEKGEGVAVDVDEDGALVVERDSQRTRVVAGDVRVRVR